jgi:kynurenine formamidase
MQIKFEHFGVNYSCVTEEAEPISIMMDFAGPQPNHFGTDRASTEILKLGGFTGDTSGGGSCNVDVLKMIPHCNGTHTETVSHIVNEDIWVGHAASAPVMVAVLITVQPQAAKKSTDSYRPDLVDTDMIITESMIRAAIDASLSDTKTDLAKLKPQALVIRTIPNEVEKCSRAYNEKNTPAFLTVEAMKLVVEMNVRHLLVDVPSVDRMYDDGLLTNHHLFWNVDEKTHELSADSWQDKTITEMVFVDEKMPDGTYALNLQVPAFCSDAAPSRPMLMPLKVIS